MNFVKLKHGNLFDEPADLVVLPCSTGGGVTGFVAKHLREYEIPHPKRGLQLGDVEIRPFDGAENVAQFVAFAVSVKAMASTEQSIEKIGSTLGTATRDHAEIRRVSAPLLGAGAGGLPPEDVIRALSTGFKSTAADDAVLTVFILHQKLFEELRGAMKRSIRIGGGIQDAVIGGRDVDDLVADLPVRENDSADRRDSSVERAPLRVFISYSGTSERHRDWVTALATHLRTNGLDARLDRWHLRAGMDIPQWMANELQLADRVVLVTDSRYAKRADGRVGGVGWETMLVQGDMSTRPVNDPRYVVVVREDVLAEGVPMYLKTKYFIHWNSDSDEAMLRTDLLKELYNVEKAPPIGEPPVFV